MSHSHSQFLSLWIVRRCRCGIIAHCKQCLSQRSLRAAVSQLLNLEFPARRKFIDSDTIREQDRPAKILEAYPCFRDLDHIIDEFRRIV
ncbi:hypothetical protein AALO_G00202210 [Alosa alosa]|uniref:Uncharacterized protein n=1 Tax=Alosa alosa TaxID=278164 RepID=A0AAV6G2V4_9TELE|nr:hypothetical protein AALO_G00202210 [Alosa alosa]